jgi:hypothetical protein
VAGKRGAEEKNGKAEEQKNRKKPLGWKRGCRERGEPEKMDRAEVHEPRGKEDRAAALDL